MHHSKKVRFRVLLSLVFTLIFSATNRDWISIKELLGEPGQAAAGTNSSALWTNPSDWCGSATATGACAPRPSFG